MLDLDSFQFCAEYEWRNKPKIGVMRANERGGEKLTVQSAHIY